MCTAVNITEGKHLFGRTLDLEYSFGESCVVVPKNYRLKYGTDREICVKERIMGIAFMYESEPLFYDAANEAGLCTAALNFPRFAKYSEEDTDGVPSHALIPTALAQCGSVSEAKKMLDGIKITSKARARSLAVTPLHWIFADREGAIVVEAVEEGVKIYDNPTGVLTNSPPFPYHLTRLCDYMALGNAQPENRIARDITLSHYCRGMGAIGLPGDYSSASRFVRAVYAKSNTLAPCGSDSVARFFHIMDTVKIPFGCVLTEEGRPVKTVYTSCADTERGVYYFNTYENRNLRSVSFSDADALGSEIFARVL